MPVPTVHTFHLESPPAGATLAAGRTQLRGWLVPKTGTPLVDIRARLDRREFAGVYGYPRADLAAHFGSSRPWLPAGFTLDVEFAAGAAEVTIAALDLTGTWVPVQTLRFTVQEGPKTAPALADPITADEFARAVRLGFVQGAPVLPPWPRVLRVGHPPFHGYLAQPHALAPALYGRLFVLGWLFHEAQAIARAFVTTDLVTLQPLEFGGEFPGVRERYRDLPAAAECRFQGMVDVSSALPAPACVRVFVELADGSMHLCLATRCRAVLTEELKLPWPAFAPLRFWRHWRAIRREVRSRGQPLATGAALRREFWASLRQYRTLAARAAGALGAPRRQPRNPGAPLRLLLITHNLNREGAPLLFAEYAAHLAQAGVKLTVLAGQDGPLREMFTRQGATVTVVDPALAAAASPADLNPELARLAATLDWSRLDLVVGNTLLSYWAVLLAHRAGKPSLLYIHESTRPAVFFQRTTPALLPAVHAALRQATAVSFNTPATRAYYEGLGSGKNFQLNAGWIDLAAIDAFRADHPRAALRTRLGVGPDELLVANIGTVCERKGQHDFLRSIALLSETDPALAARCRFVLVGGRDSLYNRELARDLAALGRSNIHVIAETSRAFDWFGAADVFACTSYEESFPRVVLEAMAFALPIVSTNVHGIPYMVRDGEEAALVPPGDVAAFSGALRRVLHDLPAARGLGARARARVSEFDAAALLPRHARFTADVVSSPA
jgi:glycosyltransferase involved in cell wall biosynthesis